MSITTFAELAATPNAQTDFLCIVTPKKRYENWTKTGGRVDAYEIIGQTFFRHPQILETPTEIFPLLSTTIRH